MKISHERNILMNIKGSIALVTGGNRGLGKAFAQALLDAGAEKVYAGARQLFETTDPRIQPIKLDITNASDIAAAVEACQDINILINNAGIASRNPLTDPAPLNALIETASMDGGNDEMATNYFGTLAMCRAFAPILKKNGGGVLANMLSALSWVVMPGFSSYCVSKAAAWAMTNGIRLELRSQGTLVVGVHAGFIDTDMVADITSPKSRPEDIAARTIEGIATGQEEILTDQTSQEIKAGTTANLSAVYQQMQQLWDSSHALA
jgi:NAD(P)-dependent dehydrogenase (short-subunit alcohol dehydrogenase family)